MCWGRIESARTLIDSVQCPSHCYTSTTIIRCCCVISAGTPFESVQCRRHRYCTGIGISIDAIREHAMTEALIHIETKTVMGLMCINRDAIGEVQ